MRKNQQPAKAFTKKPCVIATGIALSLMAAQSVYAQQATDKIEKIEVTGSRIPAPNLEGASPVTSFDAATIKVDGLRNVEDILNNLPQVFADQGSTLSNGSTGTASVSLRGLGAVRTLVLVNGRRLPAGSPTFYPTDLNQIPAPLIKRVDILTSGASSIYGSDAIAGVVNFIMNDNFQGVQLQVNGSGYNHQQQNPDGVADIIKGRALTNPTYFKVPGEKSWDGRSLDVNMTLGGNFADGKGNATVFFSYTKTDALLESERDFSSCALTSGATYTCGGSSANATGRFFPSGTLNTSPAGFDGPGSPFLGTVPGDGQDFTVDPTSGAVRKYRTALDQFNYAPYNYFQRPDERYGFNAFAHYDVNDKAKVYTEFSFHDNHTVAQIAPSGAFAFQEYKIYSDNPLLSADWRTALGFSNASGADYNQVALARRDVEGGNRQDDIRHTSFRGVVGVKGEIAQGWNYDAFFQSGKVLYQETYRNDFSKVRLQRAMDVVTDPSTGLPACRSAVNGTDPNCVPWNIWSKGGVTKAATDYLATPGLQKGFTSQSVQGISVNADLGKYGAKFPAAKNGVSVAAGVERRVEKLGLDTDVEFSSFDLAGQGGPVIGFDGQYTVNELFTEFRAPLIEGYQMAQLLSVNGSYRTSEYSNGPHTDSYGVGAEWAPVKEARLRGSYQQAVRAANLIELYTAPALNLFSSGNDPCGPDKTATAAQCALTGLAPGKYGSALLDSPAGQYNFIQSGNVALKPETGKSYTFGLVLTPMKNLSGTIDFFSIKVDQVISAYPAALVLSQCLATGDPTYCGIIHRDANGTLWASPTGYITTATKNLSKLQTQGVDFGANYVHNLSSWGRLSFNFLGTLLQKIVAEPIVGLGDYDCKGLYGITCGTPNPEWRHKLRANWSTPWNLDVALTWRYFGKVDLDLSSSNPLLAGAVSPTDKSLAARNYFDLYAQYKLTKMVTVAGGINNILDKDPPLASGTVAGLPWGNGNTFPQVYDSMGRRIFMNLTAKF
jgi:outer membrane receptor protein involved in Fe transport